MRLLPQFMLVFIKINSRQVNETLVCTEVMTRLPSPGSTFAFTMLLMRRNRQEASPLPHNSDTVSIFFLVPIPGQWVTRLCDCVSILQILCMAISSSVLREAVGPAYMSAVRKCTSPIT